MPKKLLDIIGENAKKLDSNLMTEQDFIDAFEKVISFVKGAKEATQAELEQLRNTYHLLLTTQGQRHDKAAADLQAMFDKAGVGPQMEKMMRAHEEMLARHETAIKGIRNGKDGATGPVGPRGPNGSADDATQIVGKINNSQEVIDKERVEGLAELTKRVEIATKQEAKRVIAGPNANAIQVVNLTSQTNGSLKVFAIPTMSLPLLVIGMQAPFIYIPTTHYSIGNRTLTLTAAVDAPATGQGLFILYKK